MSKKTFKVLLFSIIALGVTLRFFFASILPLWLDERYSLLFAWEGGPAILLFQSKDVHPGLFYLLLKGILFLTSDLHLLRFLTSLFPQLLGICLLLYWMNKRQFSQLSILVAALLLFLNPFLIYLGAQLRMYGLVSLFSCLTFIAVQEWMRDQESKKKFLGVVGVLLLGNASSYAFFFLSAGVLLFMVTELLTKKSWGKGAVLSAITIMIAEFFFLADIPFKKNFEAAAWIPSPSLANLPSLIMTVLGFSNDHFLAVRSLKSESIAGYVLIGVLLFCFYFYFLKIKNEFILPIKKQVLLMLLIPVAGIVLLSVLFPLLSQRHFFYLFIPKISFFLPRFFVPQLIFFSAYIAVVSSSLNMGHLTRGWKKALLLLCICLSLLWVRTYSVMMDHSNALQLNEEKKIAALQKKRELEANTDTTVTILPAWIALTSLNSKNLTQIEAIKKEVDAAEKLERLLFSNTEFNCSELNNRRVFYLPADTAATVQETYEQKVSSLESCCEEVVDSTVSKEWSCPAR